jgi:hypothetical protein
MSSTLKRIGVALILAASVAAVPVTASAQSGDQKGGEQKAGADAAKEAAAKRMADEFAEAARLEGAAGNPECVWLGRRAVSLLWRDDLDTAFRHLDLYDRFGCPGGHVQATFRCVIRQGTIDPKAPESLAARVHACWVNPSMEPQTAAQTPPPATTGTKPQ